MENGQEEGTSTQPVMAYNSQGYPKREGVEQCSFFVKNGNCKYGTTCRWHHPEFIFPNVDFNSIGLPLRPGAKDCAFYAKRKECSYGCTCKWNHPEPTEEEARVTREAMRQQMNLTLAAMNPLNGTVTQATTTGFNSKGFPVRPGVQTCAYFEKMGDCKFGASCKWNHPEGIAVQLAPQLFMQQKLQTQDEPTGDPSGFNSKGFPLRPGVQICTFFQKTGECKFGSSCKWDHDEAGVTPQTSEFNSLGYPVRPFQIACAFFTKNGTCRFGATCKWDHPEEFTALAAQSVGIGIPMPKARSDPPERFNSLGYPIRPGHTSCSFFLKTGTCSYGVECKWDHPEGMAGAGVEQPGFQKISGQAAIRVTPY